MSVHSNLKTAVESLNKLGEVLESNKKLMKETFSYVEENLTGEDKSTFQQFVKESNDLVNNAGKVDFHEAMRLMNELKEKYGKRNSSK